MNLVCNDKVLCEHIKSCGAWFVKKNFIQQWWMSIVGRGYVGLVNVKVGKTLLEIKETYKT